jgi:hypothetical protein
MWDLFARPPTKQISFSVSLTVSNFRNVAVFGGLVLLYAETLEERKVRAELLNTICLKFLVSFLVFVCRRSTSQRSEQTKVMDAAGWSCVARLYVPLAYSFRDVLHSDSELNTFAIVTILYNCTTISLPNLFTFS